MTHKPNEGVTLLTAKTLELMFPNENHEGKVEEMTTRTELGIFLEVYARLAVENAETLKELFTQNIHIEESPT